MARAKFEELNPRIYVEVGATVNLGVSVGAAKCAVGLEVDVPEDVETIDDFYEEVYEYLLDLLDGQVDEAIKFVKR